MFVKSDLIDDLEQEWRYGKGSVEPKRYYRSYKIVSRTINEARKER